MNKCLTAGLAGLLLMVGTHRGMAQGRPSGVYSQTIGPGALSPNGRTAVGSYGYGRYFYGRGFAYGSSYGYGAGPVYGGGLGNYYGSGVTSARPSGVTWYSVAGGYSTGPQTGVPWRGGGPRTESGRVAPESPIEGLARSRTVTGRDYALATKLARARLSADKSNDSTAIPVSSRRVEQDEKANKADADVKKPESK